MKKNKVFSVCTIAFCVSLSMVHQTAAQGYDTPLTFQSLNHTTTPSAASRGAGGITIGIRNDASIMFANPALLQSLQGISISLGGAQQSTRMDQEQRYGGLQNHSALNLLTEGMTGFISDPDTSMIYAGSKVRVLDQSDSVQRPFDAIGSSWANSQSKTIPMQAFVAAPFSIDEIRVVAGLGVVEYANLYRYYQNNNCFAPSVLSVLDGTISTRNLNSTPYLTQWYQYAQQRDGSIYGYGAAVSVAVMEKLWVGLSGMLLKGSTDDVEAQVGRGRMMFYQNSLRLDKLGMKSYTKTGTSDYSGAEFTLSAKYSGRTFDIGFTLKAPTTITRTFSWQSVSDSVIAVSKLNHRVDSLHSVWSTSVSGEDKMRLPWRGMLGLSLRPLENLMVGVEYELRSYASAVYTSSDGTESNPWLSLSMWHVGLEYRPTEWLALRGGAHTEGEVYEPLSNAIREEPVTYTVYSLGAGFSFSGIRLNIAYEYSSMKFVDTWSNASSINEEFRNTVVADVSYQLPW